MNEHGLGIRPASPTLPGFALLGADGGALKISSTPDAINYIVNKAEGEWASGDVEGYLFIWDYQGASVAINSSGNPVVTGPMVAGDNYVEFTFRGLVESALGDIFEIRIADPDEIVSAIYGPDNENTELTLVRENGIVTATGVMSYVVVSGMDEMVLFVEAAGGGPYTVSGFSLEILSAKYYQPNYGAGTLPLGLLPSVINAGSLFGGESIHENLVEELEQGYLGWPKFSGVYVGDSVLDYPITKNRYVDFTPLYHNASTYGVITTGSFGKQWCVGSLNLWTFYLVIYPSGRWGTLPETAYITVDYASLPYSDSNAYPVHIQHYGITLASGEYLVPSWGSAITFDILNSAARTTRKLKKSDCAIAGMSIRAFIWGPRVD